MHSRVQKNYFQGETFFVCVTVRFNFSVNTKHKMHLLYHMSLGVTHFFFFFLSLKLNQGT